MSPCFNFGLDTDNGPTRARTMNPFRASGGEKKRNRQLYGVSNGVQKVLVAWMIKSWLAACEGEKQRCLFSNDARQPHDPRLTSWHANLLVYGGPRVE